MRADLVRQRRQLGVVCQGPQLGCPLGLLARVIAIFDCQIEPRPGHEEPRPQRQGGDGVVPVDDDEMRRPAARIGEGEIGDPCIGFRRRRARQPERQRARSKRSVRERPQQAMEQKAQCNAEQLGQGPHAGMRQQVVRAREDVAECKDRVARAPHRQRHHQLRARLRPGLHMAVTCRHFVHEQRLVHLTAIHRVHARQCRKTAGPSRLPLGITKSTFDRVIASPAGPAACRSRPAPTTVRRYSGIVRAGALDR